MERNVPDSIRKAMLSRDTAVLSRRGRAGNRIQQEKRKEKKEQIELVERALQALRRDRQRRHAESEARAVVNRNNEDTCPVDN